MARKYLIYITIIIKYKWKKILESNLNQIYMNIFQKFVLKLQGIKKKQFITRVASVYKFMFCFKIFLYESIEVMFTHVLVF